MTETENLTATRAEIDAAIAQLESEHAELMAAIERANRTVESIRKADHGYYGLDTDEVAIAKLREKIAELEVKSADVLDLLNPLNAEYDARRWTRYYLVNSSDGHVHSSMHCGSCYPQTSYYWLTSESDKSAREVVEIAGERACTICFSWAPVATLARPTGYHTPAEIERAERTTEKAAKAAAKKAKEITRPDGRPLQEVGVARLGVLYYHHQIRTIVAAQRAVSSALWAISFYGESHLEAPAWHETVKQCCEALSAREGRPAAEIQAEAEAKVAKKRAAEIRKYGR